ncbi:MAG TPA: OmpA family protein [Candidatus Acidoferrum sp.]|nr:OmpA family protein [Candidatus Acidoferrum sp.]
MKFTSLFLTVCGFAVAQFALAQPALAQAPQAPNPTQQQVETGAATPIYRITVVARTTKAINYHHRSGSTRIGFRGTALMPEARGEAKVESKQGVIKIDADMEKLGPATQFGPEYLTYVMWAISPEGSSVNLGEVLVGDDRHSKLDVTTGLQAFALIVTAEPYYAVRRPSNAVIMENILRQDTKGTSEEVDAKYELIDRGGYIPTGYTFDPVVLDAKLPLEFFEARNAVRIAKSAGAERFAASSYENAIRQMKEADALATSRHENKKALISISRETVQTAEDAREVATKRIASDRAEYERNASAGREASANAATADAVRDRNEAERKKREAEAATQQAQGAQANAEAGTVDANRARDEAERKKHEAEAAAAASNQQTQDAQNAQANAEANSERDRAAAAASDAQAQSAVHDREELRAKLLQQFNLILETRDTARGLVVNMSDVLFDSGQYTLRPAAREKLAKISGIVLAYPTLLLAVEGNTDSVGTELFNQNLSEKRAESVRTYLTGQGVPESSTTAQGFGKTRPIASNDTADGRQQNRRVELIVSGEVIGTKIVSIVVLPTTASTTPR